MPNDNLEIEIFAKKLAYDTWGFINLCVAGKCDVCAMDNVGTLSIDTSGDEYGQISICKDCTRKAFEKLATTT